MRIVGGWTLIAVCAAVIGGVVWNWEEIFTLLNLVTIVAFGWAAFYIFWYAILRKL